MPNWLTSDDVANYGPEVIDVTQRAALHAVGPHLAQLEQQNAQLQQRLALEARRRLDDQVARAVPDYREVDRDPRWHRWLLGIDTLSGRVRQQLLNEAIANGDASRVRSFFDGFKREAGAQAPAAATRARAAFPSGKIYSRDEIAKLYRRRQQGAFSDAAWATQEADIIAAAREGRIRNPMDVSGK
jgi:predicted metal-dependent phosphoesterase TrpH